MWTRSRCQSGGPGRTAYQSRITQDSRRYHQSVYRRVAVPGASAGQRPFKPGIERPEYPGKKLPRNKQSQESRHGAATESLVGTRHFVVQKKEG
jgi:hypothetical protein